MRSAIALLVGGIVLSACGESPDSITSLAPLAPANARSGGGQPFIAQSIATGSSQSCAVFMSGSAYCAGADFLSQLGNGAGDSPSAIPGPVDSEARFVQVDGSWDHTCALTRDGQAYCWGWNNRGQLGNGTTTSPGNSPTPVQGGHRFKSISAGWTHTCAITEDGTAWCWGGKSNLGSSLGAPATGTCQITPTVSQPCSTEPVQVSTSLRFREIYAGLTTSCGLATDDHIYCWGANDSWIFGDETSTHASTPRIAAPDRSFSTMGLGAVVACGVELSGTTYCWGGRFGVLTGALGNGTLGASSAPVEVVGGHRFVSLELSRSNNLFTFSCGLTGSGDAYCWGHNNMGQLGSTIATTGCFFQVARPCTGTPTLVQGGLKFASLGAGSAVVCGVTTSRTAYCWGMNHVGQLGTEETVDTVCFLTNATGNVSCSNTPRRVAAPVHGRPVASALRSSVAESPAEDYRILR